MTDNADNPGSPDNTPKGRLPDYVVHTVDNSGEKSQWTNVGGAWTGNNGYIKARMADNEYILQPRAELDRIRQERQSQTTQEVAPQSGRAVTQKP